MNTLIERQMELEDQAMALTQGKIGDQEYIDGPIGQVVTGRLIPEVALSIEATIAEGWSKKKPREDTPHFVLKEAKPADLALLAIRTLLAASRMDTTALTTVSGQLGGYVEEHLGWSELHRGENKEYVKFMEKVLKRSTSERHGRGVMRHVIHDKFEVEPWSMGMKLKVGMLLAYAVADASSWFEIVTLPHNREKWMHHIKPTAELLAVMDEQADVLAHLRPNRPVMISKPLPWEDDIQGGYYKLRTPLVRKGHVIGGDKTKLYESLNRIQETPWTINTYVLDVLTTLRDDGSKVGGIPQADAMPMPAKTWNDDATPDPEELKAWKQRAKEVHETNGRARSKRLAFLMALNEAEKLTKEEEFFFPHNVDFRGRAYPLPATISPQGDDISKALLQFKEGKRVGERGQYWLAVHTANSFGYDKDSLDGRVAWCNENLDEIYAAVEDPLNNTEFWSKADKPFTFLAAAREFIGALIGGPDYISHQPIGMDGSCNGIQHFSALLKDPKGGAEVNLIPAEKPGDIYSLVLRETEALLQDKVETGTAEESTAAKAWLDSGQVNRKLVKRPTMTTPYSVSAYGIRDQLMEELNSRDVDPKTLDCGLLGKVVAEGIGIAVRAARDGQGWLIQMAEVHTQHEKDLVWTTPLGLEITQSNRKIKAERAQVTIAGQRRRQLFNKAGDKLDVRGQKNGISPNMIHSLDAAHMHLTLAALPEDISFAAVHDSFGTHAGDVDVLNAALREEFVAMYSEDVLARLHAEFEERLGCAVEAPPEAGSLDIEGVRESLYFFA